MKSTQHAPFIIMLSKHFFIPIVPSIAVARYSSIQTNLEADTNSPKADACFGSLQRAKHNMDL